MGGKKANKQWSALLFLFSIVWNAVLLLVLLYFVAFDCRHFFLLFLHFDCFYDFQIPKNTLEYKHTYQLDGNNFHSNNRILFNSFFSAFTAAQRKRKKQRKINRSTATTFNNNKFSIVIVLCRGFHLSCRLLCSPYLLLDVFNIFFCYYYFLLLNAFLIT